MFEAAGCEVSARKVPFFKFELSTKRARLGPFSDEAILLSKPSFHRI